MMPRMGMNDINVPRRPLGATACSTAIAALVPFPVFLKGPRVCLGGAVVAVSVIMMGAREEWASAQVRNQVMESLMALMHCLVLHVGSFRRLKAT